MAMGIVMWIVVVTPTLLITEDVCVDIAAIGIVVVLMVICAAMEKTGAAELYARAFLDLRGVELS